MTIDERLEKLAVRHEALTQTVELITVDLQTLKTLAQQDGENIRALARIAEIHERR
jgi:archaellum component FlaC